MNNSKTKTMFGNCKCGKPNIGSYYGGSPGMCSECFEKEQKAQAKNLFKEKNSQLLEMAKNEAKRLGITLSEAILLIK